MTPHEFWSSLRYQSRALFSRGAMEHELDDELRFHVEREADKLERAGVPRDEALRQARLAFGGVETIKEDARDVRRVRLLEEAFHDVRYAIRGIVRAPVLAASLALTIGLGVGLSASAFTIFDAYVLRPFNVRDASSLYAVNWMDRSGHYHDFSQSDVELLRRPNGVLSDVVAYRPFAVRLGDASATGEAVGENFFNLLGVRAALGRTFSPADASLPVVVLSDGAWRTRFDTDSSVIGRRVLLRGVFAQVIGVAQPGFVGLFKKPRDFWVPLAMLHALDSTASAAGEPVSMIARVAQGESAAQGRAVVASVLQTTTVSRPDSGRVARVFFESRSTPMPQSVKSYAEFAPLIVSFGLILVLACANVANILLARGIERRRELGIRLALGAARARLIRQLITESVVQTLPAAAMGFVLAWAIVTVGVRALFATLPADLAPFVRFVSLAPDWRVATFAMVATLGAAILCGLAPSLKATRLSVVQATRGDFGDGGSSTRRRGTFIIGQVAASSLLLITAAVLLREAARLGRSDTGLRTRDVVSIETGARTRARVLSVLASSRIVDTLAASAALPLDMKFPSVAVNPDGAATTIDASYNRVSAAYFDVLQIGVAAGRAFTRSDEDGAAPVVIVSEVAARRLWPNQNPLGRSLHLALSSSATAIDPISRYQGARVIGVARDVVVQSLENGKDASVLYFPMPVEGNGCCLLARVRGDPDGAKRALDAELERLAPGAVDRIDRLETFVAAGVYPFRAAYWVAAGLGLIALGLTVVGVYGVVAYLVGQRTKEIGIRIALGATTADVLRLVMDRSFKHATMGVAIGAALALALARVIAANVPGVPTFDVAAFIGAAFCVLGVCLVAALIPSRRASAIDPTTALRHD